MSGKESTKGEVFHVNRGSIFFLNCWSTQIWKIAVGGAVGKNPLPIFVPCHRIVSKSKKITGYPGGADTKEFLLELESKNSENDNTDNQINVNLSPQKSNNNSNNNSPQKNNNNNDNNNSPTIQSISKKTPQKKEYCMYGDSCYNSNPAHRNKFIHSSPPSPKSNQTNSVNNKNNISSDNNNNNNNHNNHTNNNNHNNNSIPQKKRNNNLISSIDDSSQDTQEMNENEKQILTHRSPPPSPLPTRSSSNTKKRKVGDQNQTNNNNSSQNTASHSPPSSPSTSYSAPPPSLAQTFENSDSLPPCRYGSSCYRTNPEHLQKFYHPKWFFFEYNFVCFWSKIKNFLNDILFCKFFFVYILISFVLIV